MRKGGYVLERIRESVQKVPSSEGYLHTARKSRRMKAKLRNSSATSKKTEHYTGPILNKVVSTAFLKDSLAVGSKKRLNEYQYNLSVTRGSDEDRKYDSKVIAIIEKYALNRSAIRKQLSYLSTLRDDQGYLFSRCLKKYGTTENAFELFSADDYTSFRWNRNYQAAIALLTKKFQGFDVKPLTYTCDNDVLVNLPKVNTHAGFTFIESGKKTKGENMEGVFSRYLEALEVAKSEGSFKRPIMIAFRTQASGEYEDDGTQTNTCKHKTRVVSMVDLLQIIAEMQFSVPIQRVMSQLPSYAGGKNDDDIARIISGMKSKFYHWVSIDYSSYDQTISSWLIEDAFGILKNVFSYWNEDLERVWQLVIHDFIHKDFIVSEGIIHSDRGVPSGSMFTQIIDTVANWIMVYTYFISMGEKLEMIAMGDDNLIYSDKSINMSEMASYLSKNFGVVVHDDDKTNQGSSHEPPKFLSAYWRLSGKWRHPNQILSRIAYPERWRKYDNMVTPELVVYAYILTYRAGMSELINVSQFMNDHRFAKKCLDKLVDNYSVLPGSMAYQISYGLVA